MKINELYNELIEMLELEDDEKLTLDYDLQDAEGYDSLFLMSLISFIHENFNKQITAKELKSITTVQSLVNIIGKDKFE